MTRPRRIAHGGRAPLRAAMLRVALLGVTLALVACAGGGGDVATMVPASLGPASTVTPDIAPTRAELSRVLGERRLTVAEPDVPYRPAEAPTLTDAPRAVYQVILPEDPGAGYIVIYELPDADAALAAAQEQATYLASGPGRVQTPIGTRHVLRVLGPTVVLYSWHPDAARDPRAPDVEAALETLGTPVDVPR